MNIYYDLEFINIDGNEIHNTAIINDNVKLGRGNRIGAYCVIGSFGQMRGKEKYEGKVVIGDNNTIYEQCNIQTPVGQGEVTKIGNNNIIMSQSHIAHNAEIGNNTEIGNTVIIAGYAVIKDNTKIKMGSCIRNRITIEENVIIGMGSVVVKNIKKGSVVWGNPAK